MRCKTCDYQLWNLRSRQCPECGTAFRVSDYDFVPNSVQFCCQHCGQPYYGTSERGHLVPPAFTCVSCNNPVQMDDMVLLPAEGIESDQTEPFHMPWLERANNGFWRSWWSTVKMAVRSPTKLMRGLPPDSPTGAAWWFALATWLIIAGVGVAIVLGIALVASLFPGGAGMGREPIRAILSMSIGAVLALVPMAIWAAVTHFLLLITGGTRYSFSRTCEAICYSAGTGVLVLIPVCGTYFYWIWWLVAAAIMLKERQRVHGLRATLAALTLPVLLISCPIGLIWMAATRTTRFVATRPAISIPGQTPGAATSTTSQTLTLTDALRQYARRNGRHGPQHAMELVAGGYVPPEALQLPGTATSPNTMVVGETTLEWIGSLPEVEKTAAADRAIALLPKDIVAHRLGDFVFTCQGIDFDRMSPQLWTVIAWPDPDANPGSPPGEVTVGLLNGSVATFRADSWEHELKAQNGLRMQNGLAPLPDPNVVTPARPARALAEQEP